MRCNHGIESDSCSHCAEVALLRTQRDTAQAQLADALAIARRATDACERATAEMKRARAENEHLRTELREAKVRIGELGGVAAMTFGASEDW